MPTYTVLKPVVNQQQMNDIRWTSKLSVPVESTQNAMINSYYTSLIPEEGDPSLPSESNSVTSLSSSSHFEMDFSQYNSPASSPSHFPPGFSPAPSPSVLVSEFSSDSSLSKEPAGKTLAPLMSNLTSAKPKGSMHKMALALGLITEQNPYGRGPLILSEEERLTLWREQLPIPTKLPLTKMQQDALKKVRRKIKNKLSASESRKRRKQYEEILKANIEAAEIKKLAAEMRKEWLIKEQLDLEEKIVIARRQLELRAQQISKIYVEG